MSRKGTHILTPPLTSLLKRRTSVKSMTQLLNRKKSGKRDQIIEKFGENRDSLTNIYDRALKYTQSPEIKFKKAIDNLENAEQQDFSNL